MTKSAFTIIGKISGQPVYRILGGHKNKVKLYLTTVWKNRRKGIFGDPDDWVKVAESYVENDFKAMKKRKRKSMKYIFLNRYNEKHPFNLPTQ